MGGDVKITYGVLFDLLMREKSREELQALEPNFFKDVVDYLKEKTAIASQHKETLFSEAEREKTEHQIKNIKKILKELYERREKKILNMALNRSRIKTQLIDSNALLAEERKIFDSLANQLDHHRMRILGNLLQGKAPEQDDEPVPEKKEEKKIEGEEKLFFKNREEHKNTEVEHNSLVLINQEKIPEQKTKETKLVRFISPMPRFVGTELEAYGPFDLDDIAALPAEIAELLIKKERAEEMEES